MGTTFDTAYWFDQVLPRVRTLRSYGLTTQEIIDRIQLSDPAVTNEQIFLLVAAAKILDS